MTRWNILYSWSDAQAQIIDHLRTILTAQGYTLYDPFQRVGGAVYPQTIKLFVAPSAQGWTRILLDCDPDDSALLAQALSQLSLCLELELVGRNSRFHVYVNGTAQEQLATALAPVTHDAELLVNALSADELALPALNQQVGDVTLDNLPANMQSMLDKVDNEQASTLFQKVSRRLLKTISPRDSGALLAQQPAWDSQGGQYLRAIMASLTVPDDWRTPDFATLRSAYLLHSNRPPRLLPNDAETLSTVPNALDYTPIYGGK